MHLNQNYCEWSIFMELNQIIEFLSKIELFKDLTKEELAHISSLVVYKKYNQGDFIFVENHQRMGLNIIYQGKAELLKKDVFGKYEIIRIFEPLDFLNEGALLDDYPHSASARCTEDTGILFLSRIKFNELMEENAHTVAKIISRVSRLISRRLRVAVTQAAGASVQYASGKTRLEHDLLGERNVPDESYYGIQTLRAIENFNITGIQLNHFPSLIKGLAQVKLAAAKANHKLGLLEEDVFQAISKACYELINNEYHIHFVVDMIQGGAGTSTNMNANEVIANRALEILGHEKGDYDFCHPNNHVNMSQSTNDAYPTSVNLAIFYENEKLQQALIELIASFRKKGHEFSHIITMGRTQLQDAVPMTLGQEFEAYAVTLGEEINRLEDNSKLFLEINLGGTAIGTGITAEPLYSEYATHFLREVTGLPVVLAEDLVEATQDTGAFVIYSSAVKRLAVKLSKICNDLRLLSSGPRAGFGEINLPPMQPGSSIMPGKVNPVIPEVVNQIAFKVIGNDLSVTLGAEAGQLQLNVMEPVIVFSILESIEMLVNGIKTLKYRCIDGITANEAKCREYVQNSIGLVTALNPILGYEACSKIAKEAYLTNRGVYDLVLEHELMTKEQLDEALKPENMIKPIHQERKY
jgi:aspartate ammonia-lyase